jgi:hypothetical protein
MQASRETELLNAIGLTLRAVMPAGAESITAAGEGDDDWADVAFTFTDRGGALGHFDLDDNPAAASDEIAEALMELHALMAKSGQGSWKHFSIRVSEAGDLDVAFS